MCFGYSWQLRTGCFEQLFLEEKVYACVVLLYLCYNLMHVW